MWTQPGNMHDPFHTLACSISLLLLSVIWANLTDSTLCTELKLWFAFVVRRFEPMLCYVGNRFKEAFEPLFYNIVDGLLRAGGYFPWAAQPVYKQEKAQQGEWKVKERNGKKRSEVRTYCTGTL